MRLPTSLARWRRSLVEPVTGPASAFLARLGLGPNFYTVFGFLLTLASAVAIGRGHLFLGGWLLLIGGAFDAVDGSVARALNRSTRFGAFLDSTLDQAGMGAVVVGLLAHLAGQGGLMEITLAGVALVGSFLTSYIKARAEALGLGCDVGLFTRVERILVLGIGLVVGQVLVVLWILAVATNLTAAQRFLHVGGRPEPNPTNLST